MANIVTCVNGHNYDANIYDVCPYCPSSNSANSTKLNDHDNRKTQVASPEAGKDGTVALDKSKKPKTNPPKPGVTRIIVAGKDALSERRLVGFLVSYDLAEKGNFFELFEGKNQLGSSNQSQISIRTDAGISGDHLTILFRGGKYILKDQFSTNGTFVNGQMVEEKHLVDKDELKLGQTRFIFLAIPLNYQY